jgi:hypothetical protein
MIATSGILVKRLGRDWTDLGRCTYATPSAIGIVKTLDEAGFSQSGELLSLAHRSEVAAGSDVSRGMTLLGMRASHTGLAASIVSRFLDNGTLGPRA